MPDVVMPGVEYGARNEQGQVKDRYGIWRDVLFLDMETHYATKYSLTSLTYPEYFHDERFKFHGVGVAINDGPIDYHAEPEAVAAIIHELPIAEMIMVGSNLMFDASLVLWAFAAKAAEYHDTMNFGRAYWPGQGASLDAMARRAFPNDPSKQKGHELADFKNKRELNAKQQLVLGGYCQQDVHVTRCLYYDILLNNMPRDEIRLQHETLMLYLDPKFEADIPLLHEAHQEQVDNAKAKVKASNYAKTRLSSNKQFVEILEDDLGLTVPTKVSPTTGEDIPALGQKDPAMIGMMADNPQHAAIWDARQAVKSTLLEKRAERLIQLATLIGGKLPIPLNYYGAHSGRWSGAQSINAQNLPRGSKLRQALRAPKGFKVYVIDSSNIEARMIAWLAGETEALELFRRGEDSYNDMASKIYGYPVRRKEKDADGKLTFYEEGNVGKTCRLSLGFGQGAKKLQHSLASGPMGAAPIYKPMSFCENAVFTFRNDNPNIVAHWGLMQQVIYDMMLPTTDYYVGPVRVLFEQLMMPNGLALKYPNIRHEIFEHTDGRKERQLVCDRKDGKSRQKLYGGIGSHNCIAAGTRVVTDHGVLSIEQVQRHHRLWDGGTWVTHQGLIDKGRQAVIRAHGVYMTPDHKILTSEGWTRASQSEGLDRAVAQLPDRRGLPRLGWQEVDLAFPMPLWAHDQHACDRVHEAQEQGPATLLRLHAAGVAGGKYPHPWADQAPTTCHLECYARPLSAAIASGLAQLWRAGYHGLRSLAREFHGFLSGYGPYLPTRAFAGTPRQQPRLLPWELLLGGQQNPRQKQTQQSTHRHSLGARHCVRSRRAVGHWSDYPALPPQPGLPPRTTVHRPGGTQQVYDLMDAGPRHRFTVLDAQGYPLIVHNCTQALSRNVVAEQGLRIADAFDDAQLALLVHDEVVVVMPEDGEAERLQTMLDIMRTPPAWCADLPLDAEGSVGDAYDK